MRGRAATRPRYPAEPATRSRPFGRVSLSPSLAALAAHSVCNGITPTQSARAHWSAPARFARSAPSRRSAALAPGRKPASPVRTDLAPPSCCPTAPPAAAHNTPCSYLNPAKRRGPPLRFGLLQEALGRAEKVTDREAGLRKLPNTSPAAGRSLNGASAYERPETFPPKILSGMFPTRTDPRQLPHQNRRLSAPPPPKTL